MEFFLGQTKVTVKPSRGRNMRIKVDGKTAEVFLFLPRRVSVEKAVAFAGEKSEWIESARNRILKKIAAETLPEGYIYLFGKVCAVVCVADKISYFDGVSTIYLSVPNGAKQGSYAVALNAFKRKELSRYLQEKMPVFVRNTGLLPSGWSLRTMRSRWGSCNVNTKKITFNTTLSDKPLQCVDYVILHELAHLKYPNHGKEFKAYLTVMMPDWKNRKKLLNGV